MEGKSICFLLSQHHVITGPKRVPFPRTFGILRSGSRRTLMCCGWSRLVVSSGLLGPVVSKQLVSSLNWIESLLDMLGPSPHPWVWCINRTVVPWGWGTVLQTSSPGSDGLLPSRPPLCLMHQNGGIHLRGYPRAYG